MKFFTLTLNFTPKVLRKGETAKKLRNSSARSKDSAVIDVRIGGKLDFSDRQLRS